MTSEYPIILASHLESNPMTFPLSTEQINSNAREYSHFNLNKNENLLIELKSLEF